ncbi:unnamed protein product, partial [Staurois parvus]
MLASTEGHCRGHCREDIAGAKDKVSAEGIPEQRCKCNPECSSGFLLLVLKFNSELHSGIPPRGLIRCSH